MSQADQFVVLVARLAEKCFNGRIPADRTLFIAAILCALVPETIPADMKRMLPADEWSKVRDKFAAGLAMAVDCVARQQESRWKN